MSKICGKCNYVDTCTECPSVGIFYTDKEGKSIWYNEKAREIVGSEIIDGARWQEFVHEDDVEGYIKLYLRCVRLRVRYTGSARMLVHGEWERIECIAEPYYRNGEYVGYIGVFRIAEAPKEHQKKKVLFNRE